MTADTLQHYQMQISPSPGLMWLGDSHRPQQCLLAHSREASQRNLCSRIPFHHSGNQRTLQGSVLLTPPHHWKLRGNSDISLHCTIITGTVQENPQKTVPFINAVYFNNFKLFSLVFKVQYNIHQYSISLLKICCHIHDSFASKRRAWTYLTIHFTGKQSRFRNHLFFILHQTSITTYSTLPPATLNWSIHLI